MNCTIKYNTRDTKVLRVCRTEHPAQCMYCIALTFGEQRAEICSIVRNTFSLISGLHLHVAAAVHGFSRDIECHVESHLQILIPNLFPSRSCGNPELE